MFRPYRGRKFTRSSSVAAPGRAGLSSGNRERTIPLPIVVAMATMIGLTGLVIWQIISEIL